RTMGAGQCGLAGLVIGASGLVGDALETPVTVAGSLLLASTHLLNLRLRRRTHC
ncbi:membrane protein, partial [Xanthomonas euvesicatoria]